MSFHEGSQMQMDREDRQAEAKRRCRCCNAPSHLHNLQLPEHDPECPNRPLSAPTGKRVTFVTRTAHEVVLTPAQIREMIGAPPAAKVELLPLDATNENGTVRITWST